MVQDYGCGCFWRISGLKSAFFSQLIKFPADFDQLFFGSTRKTIMASLCRIYCRTGKLFSTFSEFCVAAGQS